MLVVVVGDVGGGRCGGRQGWTTVSLMSGGRVGVLVMSSIVDQFWTGFGPETNLRHENSAGPPGIGQIRLFV